MDIVDESDTIVIGDNALRFVFTSTNLFAWAFNVEPPYVTGTVEEDFKHFKELISSGKLSFNVQKYLPKVEKLSNKETGEKGSNDDEEEADAKADARVAELLKFIANIDSSSLVSARVTKFEKDDDTNHHIDFITCATNLRSYNYRIKLSSRQDVRVTAGRITPALVTTTAMITGLCEIEFCKLMMGCQYQNQDAFFNWNINLASVAWNSFNPEPAIRKGDYTDNETGSKHKAYPPGWTSWHQLVVDQGNLTGAEFANEFNRVSNFGLITDAITCQGICLWKSTDPPSNVTLASRFAAAISGDDDDSSLVGSGSGPALRRVMRETMALQTSKLPGINVSVVGGNPFELRAIVTGPDGSPYSGGTFLVDISIPNNYPAKGPVVKFRTRIYHCNVDQSGAPCPDQLGLGGRWSASSHLRGVLSNLLTMMKEQDAESALIPSRGAQFTNHPKDFNAAAVLWTEKHAIAASLQLENENNMMEISATSDNAKIDDKARDADLSVIGRNYLIIEGLFRDGDGNIADVPLVRFVYEPEGTREYKKYEPEEPEIQEEQNVMNQEADPLPVLQCVNVEEPLRTVLDDMDEPITSTGESPYWLQAERLRHSFFTYIFFIENFVPNKKNEFFEIFFTKYERASLYADVKGCEAIKKDGSNVVCVPAVTGEGDHSESWIIVEGNKPVQALMIEDAISMEMLSPSALVEYQFEKGGRWLISSCGVESISFYRQSKFKVYEENVRKLPVDCMKSLQRLLRMGPVNTLFDPALFKSPPDEVDDWQVLNEETGKITQIARPVFQLRSWNANAKSYESIDHKLDGAPETEDEMKAWYIDLIKYLKMNLAAKGNTDVELAKLGSKDLNDLVLKGKFSNKWTDIVVSLEPPF